MTQTLEQFARDLLERACEDELVYDPQALTSGDLVGIANMLRDLIAPRQLRIKALETALNRAAYALFQAKRMVPGDDLNQFLSDEHHVACEVLDGAGMESAAPRSAAVDV